MSSIANGVAQTILQQLGGRQFMAMTGAKGFVGSDAVLLFSIPKTERGINKVRVTLTPMDMYRVEFLRVNFKKATADVVEEHDGVYCDQLQTIFTAATGLRTQLHGARRPTYTGGDVCGCGRVAPCAFCIS